MEKASNIKALYIIVNAGFADDVVEIARQQGAGGATILNARGIGPVHKEILSISLDAEKEMILSVVDADTAEKIVAAIEEKAGFKSPANSICCIMPVDKIVATQNLVSPPEKKD